VGLGSLSPGVSVEESRKQAKDLLKAFNAGDATALDRIRWNHPRFRGLTDDQIRERPFVLADAQLVIAGLHYFQSWPRLLRHIEMLERQEPRVRRFEDAADAIITGDVASLDRLLQAHPDLIHQRSSRAHEAPLLHYVAANGVEDYRQLSPKNAVEIARVLLDAGAGVDATSHAYGGGSTALGLVATSTPPRRAGVQIPLIHLLLERGGAIDGVRPGASIVRDALANGCPEAARALADRGARLDVIAAAGVGRLDRVQELADGATAPDLEKALITAAGTPGAYEVVKYLLDRGVDVAAATGWTALHSATGGADLRIIDLLIRRGAPLEQRNMYGGTVLGQAIWFAYHADPAKIGEYVRVIDLLIAAGARTDAYPKMTEHIEEVRRRSGSRDR
jgi:ankyrin repeat protein